MALRGKTREVSISDDGGTFNVLFKRWSGESDAYDFEGLASLRKILTNEKARLLHIIKIKQPKSLYELSKMLQRDFKSVSEDIKLLERFGFIEMVAEKTGKRQRLRPIIVVDYITINVKV